MIEGQGACIGVNASVDNVHEISAEEGEKWRHDWLKDSEKWLDPWFNVRKGLRYWWSWEIRESDLETYAVMFGKHNVGNLI